VWRKGVLVCAAPDILYAEDTNGDGKADLVRKLFSGFGTDNYQARVNSLEYGLDGWVYGSCGLFGGRITNDAGKPAVARGTAISASSPMRGSSNRPAAARSREGCATTGGTGSAATTATSAGITRWPRTISAAIRISPPQ